MISYDILEIRVGCIICRALVLTSYISMDDITSFFGLLKVCVWVSGAGGFHPYALQDPYVTVSRHTAPTVQPMVENQIPRKQLIWGLGVQCNLTSGSL